MTPEYKAVLSAPEWDYIVNLIAERPIKEALNLFTKLTSQLQGQPPQGESDGRSATSAATGNGDGEAGGSGQAAPSTEA